MNLTLTPTPIRFETTVGETSLKAVVEGSLSLPAGLPPIGRVVRVSALPRLSQSYAGNDEVSLEGTLDVSLLYAAEPEHGEWADDIDYERDDIDGERAGVREELYRVLWRREIPFHGAVELAGAQDDTEVLVSLAVDEVRGRVGDDGRSLEVDAVLAASVRCVRSEEAALPAWTGSEPLAPELQRESFTVDSMWLRVREVASIQGRLPLPGGVPPLLRPLDVSVTPTVDDIVVDAGSAQVTGSLDVHLAYAPAVSGTAPVEFAAWEGELKFSYRFQDSRLQEGQPARVIARTLSVDAEGTDEGRGLEVFADLELTLEIGETQTVELITGVDPSPGDAAIETRSETFSVEAVVGRGENIRAVSGVVDVPDDSPTIERLLAHEARAVADEVLVLGDRVSVAGHVDLSLLYVARGDDVDDPVYFVEWKGAIPVEVDIPVPGAHPPMTARVDLEIIDIDPDLLNRETVEWKGRVRATAVVHERQQVEAVVEAVVLEPEEENPPSYTFVVVQPGDTLWKISRRFRTTVESLLTANPHLEGPEDEPAVGSKLCVPRHRKQALVPLNAMARRNGA